MHYLLKNVYIYFLSDLAMLIQLLDPSLYPDLWGLFWAKSHPPSKFPKNLFSNFCVILLTTQPTNKRTWAKNITSLADAMEKYCPSAKKKERANLDYKDERHNRVALKQLADFFLLHPPLSRREDSV